MTQTLDVRDRPLITFFIVAYNQERYIREAVEGAFSQTYSPLEIILSDDCSSDSTFEIMQKVAAAYRGPHTIVLNRNEKNLGIGGHVNRIMELAHGELIVAAAGDDISLPQRVERTWQTYQDSGGKAMSIYSSRIVIDETGRQLGLFERPLSPRAGDLEYLLRHNCAGVIGCTHTWHRRAFDVFGGMLPDTVSEDRVIPFRSAMLGDIRYIEAPQVLYRRHARSVTAKRTSRNQAEMLAMAMRDKKRRLTILKNYEKDLQVRSDMIKVATTERDRLLFLVQKTIIQAELEVAFLGGGTRERLVVVCRGVWHHVAITALCKWLVRLLAPQLYINALRKREARGDEFSGLRPCEVEANSAQARSLSL